MVKRLVSIASTAAFRSSVFSSVDENSAEKLAAIAIRFETVDLRAHLGSWSRAAEELMAFQRGDSSTQVIQNFFQDGELLLDRFN